MTFPTAVSMEFFTLVGATRTWIVYGSSSTVGAGVALSDATAAVSEAAGAGVAVASATADEGAALVAAGATVPPQAENIPTTNTSARTRHRRFFMLLPPCQ